MTIRKDRDQKIYDFVCEHWLDKGYSPTHPEIAAACCIDNLRYVHEALRRLEDTGLIWIEAHKIRNIRVADAELNFIATRSECPDRDVQALEEILRGLHRLRQRQG